LEAVAKTKVELAQLREKHCSWNCVRPMSALDKKMDIWKKTIHVEFLSTEIYAPYSS
jgi:hypothetical protein